AQLLIELLVGDLGAGHTTYPPFFRSASCHRRARFQGGAVRDTVQPVAYALARYDGSGLADQDKECSLESVLGVLGMAQHTSANTEHHRPMPSHQRFKRGLVAPGKKAFQQLPIG